MKMNRNSKYILIALLIAVNLILRYPATPHEIGWDSFVIHISANSISLFGHLKWWLDPTCIFGFHPYSYASSVPFLLSGLSQGTGIGMEWTIWLFSSIIGLFSALTAYIMAGAIEDDDFFKILVSIIYSTSNGVLYFTTWTVSTRGLFLILLPLFLYLLLKSGKSIKFLILLFPMFLLLAATHHLFYYLGMPITAYLIVKILSRYNLLNIYPNSNQKTPNIIQSLFFLFCLIVLFLVPFLTQNFNDVSRYFWLKLQFLEYSRHIGVLIIFLFGAIVYLLTKRNKSSGELFLLITFIEITPFFYIEKYTKWFVLPIAFLLIGIGLKNMIKVILYKKAIYASLTIIIIILSSISFASYFQFLHNLNDSDANERYMEEETYMGALWVKSNIDKSLFVNDISTSQRIFSISEIPTLTGSNFNDLVYGFINPEEINITLKESILSPDFYIHDPYIDNNPSSSWFLRSILSTSINEQNSYAQRWIKKFNLSYFIENQYFQDPFTISVQSTENKIYDSGQMKIWKLSDQQWT